MDVIDVIDITIAVVIGVVFIVLVYFKHKNNVEKSQCKNVKREQDDKPVVTRNIIKIKSNYK